MNKRILTDDEFFGASNASLVGDEEFLRTPPARPAAPEPDAAPRGFGGAAPRPEPRPEPRPAPVAQERPSQYSGGPNETRANRTRRQVDEPEAPPSPFDGEPFGDLASRRGQQAARGFTDVFAGIPEAGAIVGESADLTRTEEAASEILTRQRTIDDIRARLEEPGLDATTRAFLERNLADLEEGQKELARRAEAPVVPAGARGGFATAQRIRSWSEDTFGAPDPRDTSFWGKLASGAGNMAGFVATALAGAPLGPAGAMATGGVAGASLNSSQLYGEALDAGATQEEALAAARLGGLLGATEAIPLTRALMVLPPQLRGQVSNQLVSRLLQIGMAGGEEAMQEAIVGVGNNLIAQNIYDPERGTFEDVPEQALIGFILGGAVNVGGQAFDAATADRTIGGAGPQQPPAPGGDEPPAAPAPDAPPQRPIARPDLLTPADRASPLPDADIAAGKEIMEAVEQGRPLPPAPDTPPTVPAADTAPETQAADRLEAPQGQDPALVREAAYLLSPEYGETIDSILDMNPQERAAAVEEAVEQGVTPLAPEEAQAAIDAFVDPESDPLPLTPEQRSQETVPSVQSPAPVSPVPSAPAPQGFGMATQGRVEPDVTPEELTRAEAALKVEKPAERKPENLMTFVIRQGGVWSGDALIGDVRQLDYRRPGLVKTQRMTRSTAGDNNGGLTLDEIRERAEEEGFLPPGSTVADLLDLMDRDVRGERVVRERDLGLQQEWDAFDGRGQPDPEQVALELRRQDARDVAEFKQNEPLPPVDLTDLDLVPLDAPDAATRLDQARGRARAMFDKMRVGDVLTAREAEEIARTHAESGEDLEYLVEQALTRGALNAKTRDEDLAEARVRADEIPWDEPQAADAGGSRPDGDGDASRAGVDEDERAPEGRGEADADADRADQERAPQEPQRSGTREGGRVDLTPEGEQLVIPGAEQVPDRERAERAMQQPRRGGDRPMQDDGLFGDPLNRRDLFDELSQPSPRQTLRNDVLTYAKLFGDGPLAETLRSQGFDALDVNGQRMVVTQVRTSLDDPKVFQAVVEAVPVDVMNLLARREGATEMVLDDPTMLRDGLSIPSEEAIPAPVSLFVEALVLTLEGRSTRAITEEARLRLRSGAVDLPGMGAATLEAGNGQDGQSDGPSPVRTNANTLANNVEAGNVTGQLFTAAEQQSALREIDRRVFQGIVPQSIQRDGQRILDVMREGDARAVETLRGIAKKYEHDMGLSQGGGGAGPGRVKTPRRGAVTVGVVAQEMYELGRQRIASAPESAGGDAAPPAVEQGGGSGSAAPRTRETDRGVAMFSRRRGPEPRFARRVDMFYSPLAQGIEGAKQASATPGDWKAIIGKLPGVKRAEIEWLGVEDWLDGQTGQVPREALVAFVRANEIVIEEEVGAEGVDAAGPDILISEGEPIYPDDWADEADAYLDEARDELFETGAYETEDDIPESDIQEAAERIASERFEPTDIAVTVYDSNGDWAADGVFNIEDRDYVFEGRMFDGPEDVTEWAEGEAQANGSPNDNGDFEARFDEYTEDGGENYREILLRVPDLNTTGRNRPQRTPEQEAALADLDRQEQEIYNRGGTLGQSALVTISMRRNDIFRASEMPRKPFVQSSHFEQENIVVHARVKDRKDADGKRVLFVEEIQSDLASKWRENSEPAEVTARREELRAQMERLSDERRNIQGRVGAALADYYVRENVPDAAKASRSAVYTIEDRVRGQNSELNESGNRLADALRESDLETYQAVVDLMRERKRVGDEIIALGSEKSMDPSTPETPFLGENTYALMVKRLMRMAADEGYDAVAWTPGYMQAERWNKAAQSVVERVLWNTREDGSKSFRLTMSGGSNEITGTFDEAGLISGASTGDLNGKKLATLIGPGLAKEMVEGASGDVGNQKIVFPDSGYAIAYDQQIKRSVEKLTKKHGAVVKVDRSLPSLMTRPTVREVRDEGAKPEGRPVWRVDFTPALRNAAQMAQPLFRQRESAPGVGEVEVTPVFAKLAEKVEADLNARMAELNVPAALRLNIVQSLEGTYEDGTRFTADGMFFENLITVAVDSETRSIGAVSTFNHEVVHGFRSERLWGRPYGLFREAEWNAARRDALADDALMAQVREDYRDYPPEAQIEEAIAIMYQRWTDGRLKPTSLVRIAFERISTVIKALGRALKGQGFLNSDMVFARIERGDVGARAGVEAGMAADEARFARRPAVDTETAEFKRWFGASRVVDADGKPLVVYHGTVAPDVSEFALSARGTSTGTILAREATWFTSNPSVAEGYAYLALRKAGNRASQDGRPRPDSGQNIVPVYLAMKNPLIVDAGAEDSPDLMVDSIARAKAEGRDGVIFRNSRDVSHSVSPALDGENLPIESGSMFADENLPMFLAGEKSAEDVQATLDETVRYLIDEIRETDDPDERDALQGELGTWTRIRDAWRDDPSRFTEGYPEQDVYAVFEPEQIKSVFNRGTFDPADPRIAFARRGTFTPNALARMQQAGGATFAPPATGGATTPTLFGAAFPTPERGLMTPVTERFQDNKWMLRMAQRAYEAVRGAPLPESIDAYLAMTLYDTRTSNQLEKFLENEVADITKAMTEENVSLDDVGTYLMAKHAPERNAEMAKRDPKRFGQDGGSGLTNAQAAQLLADFAAGGKTAGLDRVGRLVRKILTDDLARRLNAGLITQAQHDSYINMYQNYVPLRGSAERDDGAGQFGRIGRGFDIRGREVKAALGRMTVADNPLVQAIQMAQEGIIRAEKNRAGKTFMRLVQSAPNPELWEFIGKVPMRRMLDRDTGLVKEVPDLGSLKDDEVLSVKVGGKERYIRIKDPMLATAMKNLGVAPMTKIASGVNLLVAAFRPVTRLFSRLQTSGNPDFVLPNMQSDFLEGVMTAYDVKDRKGMVRSYVKNYGPALKAAAMYEMGQSAGAKWDRIMTEWQDSGGRINFMAFRDLEEIAGDIDAAVMGRTVAGKVVNAPMEILKFIEKINQPFESAGRLAMYAAARERGMSKAKAAAMALDASGNYTRRGEFTRGMSAFYAFFNPAVQGIEKFVRFTKNPKTLAVIGSVPLLSFTNAMLAMQMGDDEEDPEGRPLYAQISDWERTRSIIIPWGVEVDENGRQRLSYTPIRIPHNLRPLWSLGDQMAMLLTGHTTPEKAGAAVLTAVGQNFNPMGSDSLPNAIAPTALDPLVDIYTNRTWTGVPIAPQSAFSEAGAPRSNTFYEGRTKEMFITAAQGLNAATGGTRFEPGAIDIYPNHLQYLTEYAGGGFLRFITRGVETSMNAFAGVQTPPEQMPIVRMFKGKTNAQAESRRYYDVRTAVQKEQDRMRTATRNWERARGRGEDDAEAWEAIMRFEAELGARFTPGKNISWTQSVAAPFTRADRELKVLRTELYDMRLNKTLSRSQRDAERRRIESEMERVMLDSRREFAEINASLGGFVR